MSSLLPFCDIWGSHSSADKDPSLPGFWRRVDWWRESAFSEGFALSILGIPLDST
jgi:hypothetical protein